MTRATTDTFKMPLRQALAGPFAAWLGDDDWIAWYAFLSALRAEPFASDAERKIYQACTGRKQPPSKPFNEAWAIVGRRGRKSAIAAVLGVYAAVYGRWKRAPGESVRVLVVAVSKDQAAIVREFAQAILESHPSLARMVASSDAESITLTNGIRIQCVANSFRSIRGPTVVCAIFDEVAYWRDEQSANPDKEVLRAVKPSMLTVPGALLLGISSPYARSGLLWEKFSKHHGRDDSRILVWKADTRTMNPQVDAEEIATAYEDDPIAAAAEYGAEFRKDSDGYISRVAVEACVSPGILERAPEAYKQYQAFCDAAGGSGTDSFTLGIAYRNTDGIAVLAAIREWKPHFSPEQVIAEACALLKTYRIYKVVGDRYAGGFPVEQFQKHQVRFEHTEQSKSEIYIDSLASLNSGKIDLLDHEKMVNQICSLERKPSRGGRDSVDHPKSQHDDIANAALGAVLLCARKSKAFDYANFSDGSGSWENWGYMQRYAMAARGFRTGVIG